MQKEQTSSLLVNILTGAVVIGVLVVAFIVFTKKDTTVTTDAGVQSVSIAEVAQETALIGYEIDSTVRDLGELERSVASSKVIFDMPAFKNLQNYTVAVPSEPVGRTNPFVPTAWKVNMKALEAATGKSASQASTQTASVSSAQAQSSSPAQDPAGL